jgi:peptidoglycan/LPS O-acetylase OafA/YrhL
LQHRAQGKPSPSHLRREGAEAPPAAGSARAAPASRLAVLDGIRGWASLAVLLFHMLPETNRGVLPELDHTLVYALFDGPLAVYVFFILSGEALSASYLRTRDTKIIRSLAARRYFRLTLPILMACLLVYAAMVTGVAVQGKAASVLRSDWLGGFLNFDASLWGVVRYALRDVYFDLPPGSHYIPLLWTMPVELLGSCVVFGMLLLVDRMPRRKRFGVYAAFLLALLAFDRVLIGFVIGVLLTEIRLAGTMDRLRAWPRRRIATIAFAVVVAMTVSWLRARSHGDITVRYYLREYLGHTRDAPPAYANPVLMYANALALLYIVMASRRLESFFCCGLSRFLGHISFPLYLTQFAVLISLTSGLVISCVDPAHPDRLTLYGIAAVSILASILLAWAFAGVERQVLRWPNRLIAKALA